MPSGGVDRGFAPPWGQLSSSLSWPRAVQSLQRAASHVGGELPPEQCGEDYGDSGWRRPPSRHPQTKLTAGPAGWLGSGLGAANKDLGKKNEGQDPNGHCPQQPLKALMFGDQLIIQTSRFEKGGCLISWFFPRVSAL